MDYENYNMNFKLLINENLIIYLLTLNGIIIIISFIMMYFLSFSIIPTLCSVIIFITVGIIINYFILTRSKILLNENINILDKDFIDQIEDYQTTMK